MGDDDSSDEELDCDFSMDCGLQTMDCGEAVVEDSEQYDLTNVFTHTSANLSAKSEIKTVDDKMTALVASD